MRHHYDVIIVGAGPAGSTLAYELASKGIDVLLLEKETLPRYKCCAGGISVKTASLLKADFREVVEAEVSSTVVRYGDKTPFYGSYPQTIIYTVMRDKFDYLLALKAQKAGAILLQGNEVNSVIPNQEKVIVNTTSDSFAAKFLIGADGANSIVARALHLKNNPVLVTGLQAEITIPEGQMEQWKSHVLLDIGCIKGGYGWVFPKHDHLSVGIACRASKAKNLKDSFQILLHSLNLEQYPVARFSGSLVPACTGKATISQGRAALLGDAAGLVDPLTGEGIYNAILSAHLAAPAIEKAIRNNEIELSDYQKAIEKELYPEMKVAYFLSKVLFKFPWLVFETLKRDDRPWRNACLTLRGENSYTIIKKKLGLLGGIYKFLGG